MKAPAILTLILLMLISSAIFFTDLPDNKSKENNSITYQSTDFMGTVSKCYILCDETDGLERELNSYHIQFDTADGQIYTFNIPEELYESLSEGEYTVINHVQYCEKSMPFSNYYYMGTYEVMRE